MSKTALQHQQFARAIAEGTRITTALIQAGYSPAQARKGWAIVRRSRGLRDALTQQAKLLVHLGSSITAEQQEALVRGRLVLNILRGTDEGVASAKALGNDKRVSMWKPESQAGAIILTPHPAFCGLDEVVTRLLREDKQKGD